MIHQKYFPGSTVSSYLSPDEHAWDQVIYQSGKPATDAEQQLNQDVRAYVQGLLSQRTTPSGWLRSSNPNYDGRNDFTFPAVTDPAFTANAFFMRSMMALVANIPVQVVYSNTTSNTNLIQLDDPPDYGGAPPDVKRTDFVFLEVWRAQVTWSPHATGTVLVDPALPAPGDTIVIAGLPLTAVAGAPGVDQFQIGANEITTAANIASAINNVANSFDTIVSADSNSTDTVTIRAVAAGAAGNAITLSCTGTALTPSGATLTGGVDTSNKPTQSTLYVYGNTQAPSGVNLPDDIADPVIDAETTQRVQIQYRIRVTGQAEAVNFKTEADGYSNANVLAQGAQVAPVAGYPFVPADGVTVSGNSSAVDYGTLDSGLWIAGDGSSGAATDLGTVDGFVYSIPIGFVFRRNDAYQGGAGAGFDPLNNTNGALTATHALFVNPIVGTIPANTSDRPDGYFCDAIVSDDLLDLRKSVSLSGFDWKSELVSQVQALLDGGNQTWAIDASDKNVLGAGSGDVSTRFLVCNQIGRSMADGGNPPISGDTNRGDTIRSFDHVARRFGSQPIVEKVVFEVYPTYTAITYPGRYVIQANVGYNGWAVGDEIHIDLSTLNATTLGDWDPATATVVGGVVSGYYPANTTITNVLRVTHDDGDYNVAVSQNVEMQTVTGLGTDHVVVTLDANDTSATGGQNVAAYRMVGDGGTDDGSPRRIFVELEVTYPLGVGLTDTPDGDSSITPDTTVYPSGPILENDTTQRPTDWEGLLAPAYRDGFREVKVEYVANLPGSGVSSGTPITDSIVSSSDYTLYFPRRVYGSGAMVVGVTDSVAAQPHNLDITATEYGSSSRLVTLNTSGPGPSNLPLSGAGHTLCAISYFAQDAVPNYGAPGGGYQVGVYFRSKVKPTLGVMSGALTTLPDPLVVQPLVMAENLWTGQVSKGSVDASYPFVNPLDNIPVNDNSTSTYPGEWYFTCTGDISINSFDATTGMLNLHGLVPAINTSEMSFNTTAKDIEFRSFYSLADTNAYRPTMMAEGLSGVARHKVFFPFLAKATEDTVLFRKNEVLLLVVSRWAELDANNTVIFTDTDNRACVGVYRTRNNLIMIED